MQLKSYQQTALDTLRTYLEAIRAAQEKRDQIKALNLDIPYQWDEDAWKIAGYTSTYRSRANGTGGLVPAVCFKIPTGGGKTLLAAKAIDALRNLYGQKAGIILWIVPTTQIYRQTLQSLRDRTHPYRQSLDLTSGGKTLILEKDAFFSPLDVQEHLTVLLLMLPSASRQSRETLRLFRDRSGFEAFFPAEDDWQAHTELRRRIPNLDVYEAEDGMFGSTVKTSLGNTLRLLSPIIILDEGHKAYSELAQQTLLGFNPSFILELSATPPAGSNKLVEITGRQVHREGMIKLDLHLYTRASSDWRDVLRASHQHRIELERIARDYNHDTGVYIRPINLIQVERTGQKQRDKGLIHAEDVRRFLIEQCNVPPEQIAIKSSEKDEIENVDLFVPDCPVRYIITRYALQEGWDCSFAYILTVLTNPNAPTSLTQLVGRVLRQPYARKTGRPELDESYIYCYRNNSSKLLQEVQKGLQSEGLGDVTGHIILDKSTTTLRQSVAAYPRSQFKHFVGRVYLPCFVVPNGNGGWREIEYEIDILSRVDWSKVNLERFDTLQLNPSNTGNIHIRFGPDATFAPLQTNVASDMTLDPVFITRQLVGIVPNPWVAHDFVQDALRRLKNRYGDDQIKRDLGFVIEELRKLLIAERQRLAKEVFLGLVEREELRFFLVSGCANNAIPERIVVRGTRRLTTAMGEQLQRSLFDPVMEDDFNNLEQSVALYLDQHEWVLAWYRNLVHSGYSIQGWQAHRIYSDFVALGHNAPEADEPPPPITKIYVLETKGLHLKNEDTQYKQEVFELCNKLSKPTPWNAIEEEFSNHKVQFQVIFEDEWQRVLNAMLQSQEQCPD
jgi:type III restriction enzyme